MEAIIEENRNKIINKKKVFNLNKLKTSEELKKPNHLRNEAKLLEESIKPLELPTYPFLKAKKYEDCSLYSYHFFKQFSKKEIGKENNYIFNFKDNFLNDMSKIDKIFFEDYFKFEKDNNGHNMLAPLPSYSDRDLIYEFSVYHPLKNSKTQQISVSGTCFLYDLKDKIYCVLDEIHSNNTQCFFFLENAFYNDSRFEPNKSLSS